MVDGSSIVFTRKTVVDENFIRNSEKFFKSIAGIDAIQLYPDFMCQPMPTGQYTRWENDTDANMFKLNKTNLETLRTWLSHISKDEDLTVKLRVSTPQELRKRLIASWQMVSSHIVILCLRLGLLLSLLSMSGSTTFSNSKRY